jgi:hypothetical protein
MMELRRPEISFPPFWYSSALVEVNIQSYFLGCHFTAERVDFSSFYIFFICDCGVTCQVSTGKFSSTRLGRKSIERLWWVYKLVRTLIIFREEVLTPAFGRLIHAGRHAIVE